MKTLSPTTRLWGLIDKEGKEVLLVKYKGVSNFYGKNIRYATIYDINGETFNFPINK